MLVDPNIQCYQSREQHPVTGCLGQKREAPDWNKGKTPSAARGLSISGQVSDNRLLEDSPSKLKPAIPLPQLVIYCLMT